MKETKKSGPRKSFGPRTALRQSTLALLCLLAVGVVWIPGQSQAARRLTEEQIMTFIVGNLEFVLLHEIAHLVIGDKDIPIIGPEEHAADYVAALALIRGEDLTPQQKRRTTEFVIAAADAFSISWEMGSRMQAEIPYWDAHALNIQRFYQIACLLYGSDPAVFARLPEIVDLPAGRIQSCPHEFQKAERSLRWLRQSYGRQADESEGSEIEIIYEPPRSQIGKRIVEVLKASQVFENTFDRLRQGFVLSQPVLFRMRSCGQPQAAWQPDERELVMCYELVDAYYLLSRKQRASDRESLLEPD